MKKEIALKWAAALRSGQYKQGKSVLRNGANDFCCLGVLCNLHAQAHPKFAATQAEHNAYDEMCALPPSRVLQWSGMKTDTGHIHSLVNTSSMSSLVSMNDNGYDFEKIADTIERHYKEL